MKANSCAQSKIILEHKKIKAARNVWELLWFLGNKLIVNIIFLMLKVGNILVILFWLWLIFINMLCLYLGNVCFMVWHHSVSLTSILVISNITERMGSVRIFKLYFGSIMYLNVKYF